MARAEWIGSGITDWFGQNGATSHLGLLERDWWFGAQGKPPRGPCKASVFLVPCRAPISVASPNGLASHVDRMSRDNHLFSLHQAERAPHIKRREFSHRIKPRELSSHRIKRRCGGPSYQTERALLVELSGENSSHCIKRRELCISSGEGFSHHAMPLHDVFGCGNQFVIIVRTQNGL